jgi:hypothetical protein
VIILSRLTLQEITVSLGGGMLHRDLKQKELDEYGVLDCHAI